MGDTKIKQYYFHEFPISLKINRKNKTVLDPFDFIYEDRKLFD